MSSGRALVHRFVEQAAPWLLADAPGVRDALSFALRPDTITEPTETAEAHAAAIVPALARLHLDAIESAALAVFFTVEDDWETYRWLARLGAAARTRRDELVLSTSFVETALADSARASDESTPTAALARLAARGLLLPAGATVVDRHRVAAQRYALPRPLSRLLAMLAGPVATVVELAPGLHLHPPRSPSECELAAIARAIYALPSNVRQIHARTTRPASALSLVALLTDGSGASLSLDKQADAASEGIACALAALIDCPLVLLRPLSPKLLHQLIDEHTALRWIIAEPTPCPAALRHVTSLDLDDELPPGALAVLDARQPEPSRRLRQARGAIADASPTLPLLSVALTAPTFLDEAARAEQAELRARTGLLPFRAPPLPPPVEPSVRDLLDDVASHLRTRGGSSPHLGRLRRGALVVRLLAEDHGIERAAVAWLAHATSRPVVRVDPARIVSRYLGEAEERLRRQFEQAEQLGAIIYLPAAEGLLGRRIDVKSTNDRYANLQVNYLLQLLDEADHAALVFSTERSRELDPALRRRVLYTIELPRLDDAARLAYLRHLLPELPLLDLARPSFEDDDGPHDGLAQLSLEQLEQAALAALVSARAERAQLSLPHLKRALEVLVSRPGPR